MHTLASFWRSQSFHTRCTIVIYLCLAFLDNLASTLLAAATIFIVQSDTMLHWRFRLMALTLLIGAYIAIKLGCFHFRDAAEMRTFAYRYARISDFGDAVMDTDYETLQSTQEQTRIDQASVAVFSANAAGLEYHLNETMRLISWLMTLAASVTLLGLIAPRTLFVIAALQTVNLAALMIGSRLSGRWQKRLDTALSKQRRFIEQATDPARGNDIVLNRLLPWITGKSRNLTGGIVSILRRTEGIRSVTNAINGFVALLTTAAVLLVAAQDYRGSTDSAALFLVAMLCLSLTGVVQNTYETVRNLRRNLPSLRDWDAYIQSHQSKEPAEEPQGFPAAVQFRVAFRNICYRPTNGQADILHDVSISYRRGQRLAFVGNNGAGKTTLIRIIAGLIRPTGGTIEINGATVSYEDYQRFAQQHIALLPQENTLFGLTIRDNIELGRHIDDVPMHDVLRVVRLEDKVASLRHGLDTYIGTSLSADGTELSGGQKRAALIARVMLHPQEICIFDEPTSALDPIKEGEFYALLANAARDRTLMFVSHSIGTTQFCDTAYVLKAGSVLQHGDPKRLIDIPGAYRDLFGVQQQSENSER